MDSKKGNHPTAQTGVPGLDDILMGGLTEGNVFLLEGSPGTGKTTIAVRFLMAGAEIGEKGLYITLSETGGNCVAARRLTAGNWATRS